MKEIIISPSILSADFAKLGEEVSALEKAGANMVHVDVMDGHFVPNLTIGAPVVKSLKSHTNLPLDVHLMMSNPTPFLEDFAKAGSDIITVHVEALGDDLEKTIDQIHTLECKAGVSLKPQTSADFLTPEILQKLDLILIMTVEPGFGGQKFMADQCEKIEEIRQKIETSGKEIILQVDGGISPESIDLAHKAGANSFVAGSAVFKTPDYKSNIENLRKSIT